MGLHSALRFSDTLYITYTQHSFAGRWSQLHLYVYGESDAYHKSFFYTMNRSKKAALQDCVLMMISSGLPNINHY